MTKDMFGSVVLYNWGRGGDWEYVMLDKYHFQCFYGGFFSLDSCFDYICHES